LPATDFERGLGELGYTFERLQAGIAVDYKIGLGPREGSTIKLGFQVGDDWPLNPPSGPHVRPHLLPFNNTGTHHPTGGVHPSGFGSDWQYWSRPFWASVGWSNTDRSVKTYMRFIANLFATL
jgi:hypothetical protein